ncbi:MAG: hypothetical protein R3F42_02370 [Pseudomonadota bacterium]
MRSIQSKPWRLRALQAAVAVALGTVGTAQAVVVQHIAGHTFTADDLVADFTGRTFGPAGNGRYQATLCGLPGLPVCDADHAPIPGSEAVTLFPIDSEFGFNVVPFAAAFTKVIGDGVWGEGWIGNIKDLSNKKIGLEFSDAETDFFKVPAPLGTWCAGIGETAVKCSTERYVVMEHVLTCHETVAYMENDPERADPVDGTQPILLSPEDGTPLVDCATKKLDNDPYVINANGPFTGMLLSDAVLAGFTTPEDPLTYLDPNESTILEDIAYTADYSITAKDDGKPLYRWGTLIKKPNDIRIYARMKLPDAWKSGGACESLNGGLGCRVTKATLYIYHNITNNPNDQVRPEDMENEGATGRLPGYDIDVNVADYGAGSWTSDVDCYEADGHFMPAGTVLKNTDMALGGVDAIVGTDPYAWSTDLEEGYSNAWATTVDREPFEWSYDTDGDGAADYSVREPVLATPGDTLLSGPRWRLTAGKFGQDVPGLDIPNVNCAPPPYQKDLIKYTVGDSVPPNGRDVFDMLSWNPADVRSVTDPDTSDPVSPLTFTSGWVDHTANEGTIINPAVAVVNPNLDAVTINGAPVSSDFDLSIYVKGDRKPTQLYTAWLIVEYDDGNP